MSGLYFALFGLNPLAGSLLKMLGIDPEQTGRFRDCYLRRIDGEVRICLLTRNGGGNREDYVTASEALRAHPGYIRDYDEPYDSTYATYEFRVPAGKRQEVEVLVESMPTALTDDFGERFEKFRQKMQDEPNHPDVLRSMEVMAPVIERVATFLKLDQEHPGKGGKG